MKKLGILGLSIGLLAVSVFGTTVQAAELNNELQLETEAYTQKEVDVNPTVVLESYSMDTTSVIYGEDYNLHLTFRNESKTSDAAEILVTYAGNAQTQYIAPVYGNSNTFYIEEIKADSTFEYDLPICVLSSKSGYVQIPFTISYAVNERVYSYVSYISFKISAGNQAIYYTDEYEQQSNIVYMPVQSNPDAESDSTGETTSQSGTATQNSTNSGIDSTTIIMGVAVIVAILALFGLIFGRKKK